MIKFCYVGYLRPPTETQSHRTAAPHLWKQDFNYMAEWCLSSTTKGRSGRLRWKRSWGETCTHTHTCTQQTWILTYVQVERRLAFTHLRSWMLSAKWVDQTPGSRTLLVRTKKDTFDCISNFYIWIYDRSDCWESFGLHFGIGGAAVFFDAVSQTALKGCCVTWI